MTDRSTKIIPNFQAVARCLDPEILKILGSHGTFLLDELLEKLKGSSINEVNFMERAVFIEKLANTVIATTQQGHSQQYLTNKISTFIKGSILDLTQENSKIVNLLLSGINCNLLQPDGKGWQKGKLKICFEFTPEEVAPIATQEPPAETHASPLDEIRQLSNELTSMVSIEQN